MTEEMRQVLSKTETGRELIVYIEQLEKENSMLIDRVYKLESRLSEK